MFVPRQSDGLLESLRKMCFAVFLKNIKYNYSDLVGFIVQTLLECI